MKKVVHISSSCDASRPCPGLFGALFRALAVSFAEAGEAEGWKTYSVPPSAPTRMASAVKSPFAVPPSVDPGLRAPLERFHRALDMGSLIDGCRAGLDAYAGLIAGADIVHAHDPLAAAAFARSDRFRGGPKLCLTPASLSGPDGRSAECPWLEPVEREALGAADFLMLPSRSYYLEAGKFYGPLNPHYVVPPGLEDESPVRTGVLRTRLKVPDQALLVTAVCGSGADRDALFFMEAFAEARRAVPGKLFGLVSGTGPGGLEDKIRALKLEGSFAVLEPAAPSWDVLSGTDIFFSAFPGASAELAPLEALRAGLPTAAADEGWSAEAAGWGEGALMFKAGDPAAAGAALAAIAGSPLERLHRSGRAREYFIKRHSLSKFVRTAAAAYSDMTGPRASAGAAGGYN